MQFLYINFKFLLIKYILRLFLILFLFKFKTYNLLFIDKSFKSYYFYFHLLNIFQIVYILILYYILQYLY